MSRDATMNAITIYPEDQIDPASGEPVTGADGEVMVGAGIRANAADPADDIRPTITGGELGGLLEVRDKLLPELDDQLQEFGTVLRHQLNEAHNGANPAGGYGPSLLGTQVRSDLDPAFDSMSGTVWFHVDDGATVNTVSIDLGTIPVGASATEAIRTAINGSPHLDASFDGDRLRLETSTGNGSIAMAHGVEGAGQEARITTIEAGREREYNFSHFFGFNNFAREPVAAADDSTALALRDDIAADPQKIASAKLDVAPGPPPAGTLGGVGDSRGLGDLAAALDARMGTVGRGGLPNATVSAREYLGDVTSIQAMRAASAERAAENDGVLAEELDFQKAGISGVNLDEEMAHLLELQQAYSTSARLITAADEMLQTLLNAKR
jgi:flagellar hook-associated protein 1 FlgK